MSCSLPYRTEVKRLTAELEQAKRSAVEAEADFFQWKAVTSLALQSPEAPKGATEDAKRLADLLCPPHANLDANGKLEPFDNCIACIRNERDELQARPLSPEPQERK